MLCRFEFTTFLLGRLSPEFVAVLSFSGGATNVRCMEGADSSESLQGRADFFLFVQNFKTIYLPTKLHFFCKYCGCALWFICLHWSLRGRYLCVYASQTTIWFHSTPYIFSEPSYQSTASDILFIIITFDLTSIVYYMKTKYRQFSS